MIIGRRIVKMPSLKIGKIKTDSKLLHSLGLRMKVSHFEVDEKPINERLIFFINNEKNVIHGSSRKWIMGSHSTSGRKVIIEKGGTLNSTTPQIKYDNPNRWDGSIILRRIPSLQI